MSLGVHNQKEARWIEELSRSCRDCDKKKLKSSIDKPGIERCQEAVEIALKKFFKEKKNADMNAIKYAIQPMIQITF